MKRRSTSCTRSTASSAKHKVEKKPPSTVNSSDITPQWQGLLADAIDRLLERSIHVQPTDLGDNPTPIRFSRDSAPVNAPVATPNTANTPDAPKAAVTPPPTDSAPLDVSLTLSIKISGGTDFSQWQVCLSSSSCPGTTVRCRNASPCRALRSSICSQTGSAGSHHRFLLVFPRHLSGSFRSGCTSLDRVPSSSSVLRRLPLFGSYPPNPCWMPSFFSCHGSPGRSPLALRRHDCARCGDLFLPGRSRPSPRRCCHFRMDVCSCVPPPPRCGGILRTPFIRCTMAFNTIPVRLPWLRGDGLSRRQQWVLARAQTESRNTGK